MQINSMSRLLICGGTGSGKSNTAYGLLSDMRSRGYPVAIIDHVGEYGGLPGVDVIKAGSWSPEAMALELNKTNASVAIDMCGVNKVAWAKRFFIALLGHKRRAPILIVVDEAHNYAPQRDPLEGQALNNLASEGRKLGYGLMLITQRVAKLDKDCASQLSTWIIHKHFVRADLITLKDSIGELADSLKTLAVGEAVIFGAGPDEVVKFPLAKAKNRGGSPEPRPVRGRDLSRLEAPRAGAGVFMSQPEPVQAQAEPEGAGYNGYVVMAVIVIIAVIVGGVIIYKRFVAPAEPAGGRLYAPGSG